MWRNKTNQVKNQKESKTKNQKESKAKDKEKKIMYKPKHFRLEELVPPQLLQRGSDFIYQNLFDPNVLMLADYLQERFGTMTGNDYYWGGKYKDRGFRTADSTTGGECSQHRYGRGIDLKPKNVSAKEIRLHIFANRNYGILKLVGAIEVEVSWLHFDTRQRKVPTEILTFTG
jgi:hypothetical protein